MRPVTSTGNVVKGEVNIVYLNASVLAYNFVGQKIHIFFEAQIKNYYFSRHHYFIDVQFKSYLMNMIIQIQK